MRSFDSEGLKIGIKEKGSKVIMTWLGKSRSMKPSALLDPYLSEVVENSKDKELIINFSILESMNSSTVPPILNFIKKLEANSIKSEIQYNNNVDWQRASFIPLSSILLSYKYVKIMPTN